MFSTILDQTDGLDITEALICTGVALAIGIVLAIAYFYTGECSKNLAIAIAILPVIVEVIIMMVNGNLGTGIAIAGAFSLVRFRSYPGTSREIAVVFAAMACGLAAGMGYLTFAAMTAVICIAVFVVLSKTKFGEHKNGGKLELKITIPEDLEYDEIFDDLFKKYTKSYSFERIKTTNLGSMYELCYTIVMKNIKQQKAMIDDIRCRNGNLSVQCGKAKTVIEQL